jgi:hypothetical protein
MGSQTAAGSSLALSAMLPSSFDAAGYAALTYVEIGQVEKLGSFGASFAKVEFQALKGAKQKFKGSADYGALQPSIALDALDAGQILLQTASDDETQKLYSFRVTFPDGSQRYFRGRVFGAPETADGADSMLMATPTVEICSKVVKLEAGVTPTPSPTLSKPSISPTSGAVGTTFTATDGTKCRRVADARKYRCRDERRDDHVDVDRRDRIGGNRDANTGPFANISFDRVERSRRYAGIEHLERAFRCHAIGDAERRAAGHSRQCLGWMEGRCRHVRAVGGHDQLRRRSYQRY